MNPANTRDVMYGGECASGVGSRVQVPLFGREIAPAIDHHTTTIPLVVEKAKKRKNLQRCKICGKEFALPEWRKLHDSTGFNKEPKCNVPASMREEGYPSKGKMPRKSRAKSAVEKAKHRQKTVRQAKRCRQCGQKFAEPPWNRLHPGAAGNSPRPNIFCKVDRKDYAPKFPLGDNERFPP